MNEARPYEVRPNDFTTAEVDEANDTMTFMVPNRRIAHLIRLGLSTERRQRERRAARKRQRLARKRSRRG